jgi:hypothetical protein
MAVKKTPVLPAKNKDIKARVIKKHIISAVISLAWCAAVVAAVSVYDNDIQVNYIIAVQVMIATIAIPVCLLRPDRIIFDRSWSGVVKSVARTNQPQNPLIGFMQRTADVIVPVVTLRIEKTNGRTVIKQHRLKKEQDQYAEALAAYYSTGAAVYHYRGLKYLKKENNSVQVSGIEHRLCVVCGNFDDMKYAKCRHCKSTFVD